MTITKDILSLLKDNNLNELEKIVFIELHIEQNETKIAEDLGKSSQTIARAIKSLKDNGYIKENKQQYKTIIERDFLTGRTLRKTKKADKYELLR